MTVTRAGGVDFLMFDEKDRNDPDARVEASERLVPAALR